MHAIMLSLKYVGIEIQKKSEQTFVEIIPL